MNKLMEGYFKGQVNKWLLQWRVQKINGWMDGCLPDSMLNTLHTSPCFIHIEISRRKKYFHFIDKVVELRKDH